MKGNNGANCHTKSNDFNDLCALEMVPPNEIAKLGHGLHGVTEGGQYPKEAIKKQVVIKEQGISNPLRPRLLSMKDAAMYMGRTVWGMRELYWSKKIPMVQDGKKIYFDIEELNGYINRNKRYFGE
jgi:hypothetical protein